MSEHLEQAVGQSATPFHDLDAFLDQPRISGLALAPDGTRLVVGVQELSADRTRFVGALWEVDPEGRRPARRLTRSKQGESAPGFRPDGTLLFLSSRPDPDSKEENGEEESALWALPAHGGDAERVLSRPGGIDGYTTARADDRIALTASLLPGAEDDPDKDAELRAARKKAKVQAILHEEPMVRFWDHDLGPAGPRVLTHRQDAAVDCGKTSRFSAEAALSADGTLLAHTIDTGDTPDDQHLAVVVSDAATGKRIRLIDDPGLDCSAPAFTPDGRGLVLHAEHRPQVERSPDSTLHLIADARDPECQPRDLLPEFDLWPGAPVVSPVAGEDGALTVFFSADQAGHAPVFRLTVHQQTEAQPELLRLTASGAHTDLAAAPDGRTLYALRSHIDAPPTPVRLDASAPDQEPTVLPAPGDITSDTLPGTLTEVRATAEDGTALRSWLVLPTGAGAEAPAPLLLWVHGGPQGSWNAWTWRWNPWVAAAAGYAVLLPDPALSTGYGQEMHARGWGEWGGNPYRDVIALTDAALERPDLDADRTAMMGGSFGGYMANWIATSTDRFRAIVTHASLWNLPAFAGTTDAPHYFRREVGTPEGRPERYLENSPHFRVEKISTPMLVIHGDKDYRVPIGEGLALWTDLLRFEVPAKFLYFPDEGHWILKPNNIKLWYRTWLNFMAHHVLGEEWVRPEHV